MKIRSFHINNKIQICCAVVITSLFAAALISNLGSSSINAFAQTSQNMTSQNATQQQQATTFIDNPRFVNFTQNLRMLLQQSNLNTTSSPEGIRDAVQAFMSSPSFAEFQQKVSQFAQEAGLNMTRLESAAPNGNITNALQNFTQLIGQNR
ncbi:MAG TPA: hypothetical protein VFS97_00415 [Nitrososphaeraceae archaeon]|nr:hypothetical protein [Nitrososphaeraceae archaeon]